MERIEIAPPEWHGFVDGFSRRHQGWRVTLGLIDTDVLRYDEEVEAHLLERDAIFHGLSFDRSTDDRLDVMVASNGSHALYHVRQPHHLFLATEGDAEAALRVDGDEGQTLLLRFRSDLAPEHVGDITPEEAH